MSKISQIIKEFSGPSDYAELVPKLGVVNAAYYASQAQGFPWLQQVPEEYVSLLNWLSKQRVGRYLEIGIGNGASFVINSCVLQAKEYVAVDNLSYGQNRAQVESWIGELAASGKNARLLLLDSDHFFKTNVQKFDLIFIDGDHSYDGVKRDYVESCKILNEGGHIIFHDVNSAMCPGVMRLWAEIKHANCLEFIHSTTCGIGVWSK